jgi:hypothetical protein
MHHVLQTSNTLIVNRGTYSKAVCGSDFGYAVCPVLWERYLACQIHFEFVHCQWTGLLWYTYCRGQCHNTNTHVNTVGNVLIDRRVTIVLYALRPVVTSMEVLHKFMK